MSYSLACSEKENSASITTLIFNLNSKLPSEYQDYLTEVIESYFRTATILKIEEIESALRKEETIYLTSHFAVSCLQRGIPVSYQFVIEGREIFDNEGNGHIQILELKNIRSLN